MKDYAAMSDAEINASVAKIMFEVNEGIATPYSHRPDAYIYHLNGLHSVKDYCNNPADAWPIIVDNKIAIANFTDGNSASWSTKWGMVSNFYSEGESPLRCAMIVFLMMREGE